MSKRDREKGRQRKKRNFNISDKPQWLICCEGESEVVYLRSLVDDLAHGTPHNIHIGVSGSPCNKRGLCGACGQQGQKLVNSAEICALGKSYDKIWVVFDEDGETAAGAQADKRKDFREAISKWSKTEPGERTVEIAWNKPKFEHWLLLAREEFRKSGIDKTEDDVKVALYDHYKVDPRRGAVPEKIRPLIKKPYPESYKVFGGLEGARTAVRRAKSYYIAKDIAEREKSGNFSDLPFGSNFYRLIRELFQYFGQDI